MKVSVTAKDLKEGLGIAGRGLATNTTLPILKNIKVAAEPGGNPGLPPRLVLEATDLERHFITWFPAQVEVAGTMTVPGRSLLEIASALPEADVSLQIPAGRERLQLTCRRSEYDLQGMNAADMPAMPELDPEKVTEFRMSERDLRGAVARVSFAVSEDDTRPILTGCLFRVAARPSMTPGAGRLTCAATDTHRLAVWEGDVEGLRHPADDPTSVIVPGRSLAEIARVLQDRDEQVTVQITPVGVRFQTERTQIYTRVIEGAFPRFERVIPSNHTRTCTANREDLLAATRRARMVARDAASRDRVILKLSAGQLTLEAEAGDLGNAHEELLLTLTGDDIEIAINASFLIEALAAQPDPDVWFGMREPLSPVLIAPQEGHSYRVVLMPMQVQ